MVKFGDFSPMCKKPGVQKNLHNWPFYTFFIIKKAAVIFNLETFIFRPQICTEWKAFHFCSYPQVQIEGTLYCPMRIESTYQVYWLLSHGFLSLTATNFVKYHPNITHYCFFSKLAKRMKNCCNKIKLKIYCWFLM